MTAKKCTKKRDARAKLLFRLTNYKPIAFLPFLLPSPSLLLHLPSESVECSGEYVVMSFASRTTSPYAHAPQELGHRELSIVVNLHERKFLNRYSYFKEMIVVVKRFCQVFNI